MNMVSGKVAVMKRREMMTSSQPKQPSLPEFLSVERVERETFLHTFPQAFPPVCLK